MNNVMNKFCQKLLCCSRLQCQQTKLLFTRASLNSVLDQNATQLDSKDASSELSKDLHLKIKMAGPISVANYMKQVLTHPTKGYYIKKDVFGLAGDFVTSPEISQLFGEMIAIWVISEYKKIHNEPIQLVELGPGRGTLSRDILRVFRQLHMSDQISLHLVEISPVLSTIQEKALCTPESTVVDENAPAGRHYKRGKTPEYVDVFWYKSVLDIPHAFSIFIAQEFFDALPTYKFQRTKDGWFEVLVDIDRTNLSEEKFRYVLSKTDMCEALLDKNEKRDHVEISIEALNIIRYMSSAITQNGGFSLIIDYGHDGDKTDTFRAFRQHKQCDPLSRPGSADLTADVDFSQLKKVAKETSNLLCYGPVTQRDFLLELGINVRLLNLCKVANAEQKKKLELGYNKIVGPDEMGTCFKVVSMFPDVLKEYFQKFPVYGFSTYKNPAD